MTISTIQAANLATRYHDAMTMVSTQSSLHLAGRISPRQALEAYLQACKVCGVQLHNEHWEANAEIVVVELTQKRRHAFKKMLEIS
jgi:hypothetical protein